MKSPNLGRYALNSCVATVLLAGCGQSHLPSGASLENVSRVENTDSQTFHYTGKGQQFRVPAGVHKITVEAWGAAGGASDIAGGNGGRVSAIIPVTPGEKLLVFVGGAGSGAHGGFGGGADGGTSDHYPKGCQNDCAGGGGGGASDIRLDGSALSDRIFVAGGGGGAGGDDYSYTSSGSSGDGPIGGGGGRLIGGGGKPARFGAHGGGGGTQSKGGRGGAGGPGINHGEEGGSGARGTLADGGAGGQGTRMVMLPAVLAVAEATTAGAAVEAAAAGPPQVSFRVAVAVVDHPMSSRVPPTFTCGRAGKTRQAMGW